MSGLPQTLEVTGVPRHVGSWSVAGIPGFVPAVLGRWQREHGSLPQRFSLVMCPQVEVNARGGLPREVTELTDPRLRCRHFTGCHRPYLVILFTGPDAEVQCSRILPMLAWCEAYRVCIERNAIRMDFAGATEDADEPATPTGRTPRALKDLLASGELVRILA